MVQNHVENIQESGLAHRQLLSASSESHPERTKAAADMYLRLLSTQVEASDLRVYVTKDSNIYEDQFIQAARDGSDQIQPTLILIGTRLGIDQVTPVYWDGLQSALKYPQSVGVAG